MWTLFYCFLVISFIFLYLKRSEKALIILLLTLLTGWSIATPFMMVPLGKLLILIALSIAVIFREKWYKFGRNNSRYTASRTLNILMLIFTFLSVISVVFFTPKYNIPGRISMGVDSSLVYFVSLPVFRCSKGPSTLFRVVAIAIVIYMVLGLTGIVLNDPLFSVVSESSEIAAIRSSERSYINKVLAIANFGKESLQRTYELRLRFLSFDPNSLATVVLASIPATIQYLQACSYKLLKLVVSLIMLCVIVFTGSRTAILVGMLMFLFAFRKLPWMLKLFIPIVIGIVGFIFWEYIELIARLDSVASHNSILEANGRSGRWLYHLGKVSYDNILVGDGTSGFQGSWSTMAHNVYISLIYKVGLIGAITYILILLVLFNRIKHFEQNVRVYIVLTLLAFVLIGMTQETLHARGPSGLLFVFFAGLASLSNNQQKLNS